MKAQLKNARAVAKDHIEYLREDGHNPYDVIKAITIDLYGEPVLPTNWGIVELVLTLAAIEGMPISLAAIRRCRLQRSSDDIPGRKIERLSHG